MIDLKILSRLQSDPDYVLCPRYGNSLSRLREQYPDGIPEKVAAAAMGMTEAQFHGHYGRIVQQAREVLNEDSE